MNPSSLCRLQYFRDERQYYQEKTRVNNKQQLTVRTIRKLLHVTLASQSQLGSGKVKEQGSVLSIQHWEMKKVVQIFCKPFLGLCH